MKIKDGIVRKIRLIASALLVQGPALALTAAEVKAGDFTELNSALERFADSGKGITVGVCAVTLVVVGLCFIIPVRRLNEFAKEHVVSIIIGALIIMGATAIATSLVTNFGGSFGS